MMTSPEENKARKLYQSLTPLGELFNQDPLTKRKEFFYALDGTLIVPPEYRKSGKRLIRTIHHKPIKIADWLPPVKGSNRDYNLGNRLALQDLYRVYRLGIKAGLLDPRSGCYAFIGPLDGMVRVWSANPLRKWHLNPGSIAPEEIVNFCYHRQGYLP